MIRFRPRRRGRRRWAHLRRPANIAAALVVSVLLLGVLGFGYGTLPALGPALDPGRGAWTSAAGGEPVRSQTLSLPGLQHAVTVSFTAHGVPSVRAASDHDMFLALGYVHAQFRLAEMDEERRLGEGRLAQLGGPTDLASDEFELRLGLLRTAQTGVGADAEGQPGRPGADRLRPGRQRIGSRRSAPAVSGQPPSPWPACTRARGPRSTASSSRASSPRSSTSPPPRWTTRCSSAPSAPPAPWTGSRSSRKTRRPPTTQARTPSSR